MYRPVISALLFGIIQIAPAAPEKTTGIEDLVISPPSGPLEITQRLSASGVVVMDFDSGQQVYGKQADVRRPIASLTKLMTALIIVENHDMDEVVKVPQWASKIEGNSAYLPAGEEFTVGSLLSALLIASANDAAYVLAAFHSGTEEDFVYEMNERARMLGLKDTRFRNPSGLDNYEQWSTPRDIAWLAMHAIGREEIKSRLSKSSATIFSLGGTPVGLVHTHALMHSNNGHVPADGGAIVVAGKTGTTDGARQCLISIVEHGSGTYIVVLLYSSQRYEDMKTVMKFIGAGGMRSLTSSTISTVSNVSRQTFNVPRLTFDVSPSRLDRPSGQGPAATEAATERPMSESAP